MAHEFEEFHEELRSVAGDLLAKDRTVEWPVLADAGWTGLEMADHFGGSAATFGEVAIVCEEIGRAASATNYLGSGVLGGGAPTVLVEPVRHRGAMLVVVDQVLHVHGLFQADLLGDLLEPL